ncbi:MAG: Gfo/Idh/MocA family oxidoreductase [bacterium]|nr:Gfo/Idh/MocA family oxidoreductase [bacterium]
MTAFQVQQTAELPAQPLPIVSIGMGGIVHDAHYPAYRKAGFAVVGGYDSIPERARLMAETFGVPALYSSLSEAVRHAPPDAVFDVAVPGSAIVDVLREMPPGRAVLIQKPMGETLAQADTILKLCREKHLTAAINFQMRWMPHIIAARSMIDQGLIGDVVDLEVRMQVYTPWSNWRYLFPMPRIEMLYHSIHYIDLMRSFLGNPARVYARTLKHPVTAPQIAATRSMIIMDYGDSVRANIMTNHGHIYGGEKEQSYVKWEGSKGAIMVTAGLNMDYPRGKPDTFEYVLLETDRTPIWQTLDIAGSWFPDAFIGTMSSLQRFVRGETDVLPTRVEDAYHTMAVVEAAYQSSESGGTVPPYQPMSETR